MTAFEDRCKFLRITTATTATSRRRPPPPPAMAATMIVTVLSDSPGAGPGMGAGTGPRVGERAGPGVGEGAGPMSGHVEAADRHGEGARQPLSALSGRLAESMRMKSVNQSPPRSVALGCAELLA